MIENSNVAILEVRAGTGVGGKNQGPRTSTNVFEIRSKKVLKLTSLKTV
jgi:hypothetical protein